MTKQEFQDGINRLRRTYGEKAYPEERALQFYADLHDMPDGWFSKTVGNLIGSYRMPPLLPEFRKAASEAREELRSRQRAEEAYHSKSFMAGRTLPKDDQRMIMDTIRRKLTGDCPDSEWDEFMKMLGGMK